MIVELGAHIKVMSIVLRCRCCFVCDMPESDCVCVCRRSNCKQNFSAAAFVVCLAPFVAVAVVRGGLNGAPCLSSSFPRLFGVRVR